MTLTLADFLHRALSAVLTDSEVCQMLKPGPPFVITDINGRRLKVVIVDISAN